MKLAELVGGQLLGLTFGIVQVQVSPGTPLSDPIVHGYRNHTSAIGTLAVGGAADRGNLQASATRAAEPNEAIVDLAGGLGTVEADPGVLAEIDRGLAETPC